MTVVLATPIGDIPVVSSWVQLAVAVLQITTLVMLLLFGLLARRWVRAKLVRMEHLAQRMANTAAASHDVLGEARVVLDLVTRNAHMSGQQRDDSLDALKKVRETATVVQQKVDEVVDVFEAVRESLPGQWDGSTERRGDGPPSSRRLPRITPTVPPAPLPQPPEETPP